MLPTNVNIKQSIKLLIVEDNEADQIILKRFFSNEFKCEFYIAGSVKEAISQLQTRDFNVLLTDFSLGDGTAEDILTYIKSNTKLKAEADQDFVLDRVLIILTGAGNDELAVKFMRKGASDYIIKDLEFNFLKILPLTIERALKRIAIEKEIREKTQILNGILTNIPIIVFKTDEKGIITDIIGSGVKRFNLDSGSPISGQSLFDMYSDLSGSIKKGIKQVFSNPGKSINFIAEITLNETTGFFENYLFFNSDQTEGGCIGFAIDITEKREAETQLSQVYQGVQNVFSQLSKIQNQKYLK